MFSKVLLYYLTTIAVMSDSETEETNVHQMGIDEKINLYLNHQLEYAGSDESQSARSVSPFYSNCRPGSRERNLLRHSQCFIPNADAVRGRSKTKLSSTKAPTTVKPTNRRSQVLELAPQKLLTKKSNPASTVTPKPPPASLKFQSAMKLVREKGKAIPAKPKTQTVKKSERPRNCRSPNSGSIVRFPLNNSVGFLIEETVPNYLSV